ncbi:hypothetical protein [Massilia sp. CCM 8734]|nr:hypothetical protein [Massilia sp. CCM 8734]
MPRSFIVPPLCKKALAGHLAEAVERRAGAAGAAQGAEVDAAGA